MKFASLSRRWFVFGLLILALCILVQGVSAVPTFISYQGKLANNTNGTPYNLASINISITTFGDLNDIQWQRTFNDTVDSQGVFSLVLGRNQTLNLTPGVNYYMKVEVDLNSATFGTADITYGDGNPAGDYIIVNGGGPRNATELLTNDGTTTVQDHNHDGSDSSSSLGPASGNLTINDDLNVSGIFFVPEICLAQDCRTTWPGASASNNTYLNFSRVTIGTATGNGLAYGGINLSGPLYGSDTSQFGDYTGSPTLLLAKDGGSGVATLSWGISGSDWDMLMDVNEHIMLRSNINDKNFTLSLRTGNTNYKYFDLDVQGNAVNFPRGNVSIGTFDGTAALTVDGNVSLNSSLFVLESGFVGIGTGAPTDELTVIGDVNVTNTVNATQFCIGGDCIPDWDNLNGTDGTGGWTTGSGIIYNSTTTGVGVGTASPASLLHVNGTGDLLNISNSSHSFLSVNESTGAVGVGTDDPSTIFDIQSPLNNSYTRISTNLGANATTNQMVRVYNTYNAAASHQRMAILNFLAHYSDNAASQGIIGLVADGDRQGNLIFAVRGGSSQPGVLERMRIGYQGYVGINTTSPSGHLDVNGTLCIDGTCIDNWDGVNSSGSADGTGGWTTGSGIIYNDTVTGVGIGTPTPDALLQVNGSGHLVNVSNSDTPILYVNGTTGNVGIGTQDPNTQLHVHKDSGVSSVRIKSDDNYVVLALQEGLAGGTSAGWGLYNGFPSAGDFTIRENGVQNAIIIKNTSGHVGIGTASPTAPLHVNGTGTLVNFSNRTHTLFTVSEATGRAGINTGTPDGFFEIVAPGPNIILSDTDGSFTDDVELYNNGREFIIRDESSDADLLAIRLDASQGRVGLGTTAPQARLDVRGNVTLNGTLYVDGDQEVGIGTPNPESLFHVSGTGHLVNVSNSTHSLLYVNGSSGHVGVGTMTPRAVISTVPSGKTFQVRGDSNTRIVIDGTTANLVLVDQDAGADDKIFQLLTSNGVSKFRSLNDAQSATISEDILVMDMGTGHVGINTSTTSDELTISGDVNVTRSVNATQFCIGGDCIPDWDNLNGSTSDGTGGWTTGSGIIYNDTVTGVGIGTPTPDALLQVNGSGHLLNVSNSDTPILYANGTTSRVGIGTQSPEAPLHINSSSSTYFEGLLIENPLTGPPGSTSINLRSFNDGISKLGNELISYYDGSGDANLLISTTDGGVRHNNTKFTSYGTVFAPGQDVTSIFSSATLDIISDSGNDGIQIRENDQTEYWMIGTNTAGDLIFKDETIQTITFEDGGDVGIGTIAPVSKLHVNGTGDLLNVSNGTYSLLFVDEAADRVGMGTHNPSYALHVSRSSGDATVAITNSDATGYAKQLISSSNNGDVYTHYETSGGFVDWVSGLDNSDGDYKIGTGETMGSATKLTVESSGEIGIGTESPSSNLHVNGTSYFDYDSSSDPDGITLNVSNRYNGTTDGANITGINVFVSSNKSPGHLDSSLTGINATSKFTGRLGTCCSNPGNITITGGSFVANMFPSAGSGFTNDVIAIGVKGMALRNQSDSSYALTSYGGYFSAEGYTGDAPGTAIGIYATGYGGDLNYAGLFNGSINVTENVYYGGNLTGYGADFAEMFATAESVSWGDVVCLTSNQSIEKCSMRSQKSVVGVVSQQPTIIGNAKVDGVPVGITGILRTKVQGPIEAYDLLTTGEEGQATKATFEDFGAILGKAMEPCEDQCIINVLVGLQ